MLVKEDELDVVKTESEESEEQVQEEVDDLLDGDADEAEEEIEDKPDKTKGWTVDDYAKAYSNLEKKIGEQGRIIGELKKSKEPKPEPEKKQSIEDIPNMTDEELEEWRLRYEAWFNIPDVAINESANYGQATIGFHKVLTEIASRKINHNATRKEAEATNSASMESFKKEWKTILSSEQVTKIAEYAKSKLSEDGKIDGTLLEVALHRLYPSVYTANFSTKIADKERDRIKNAQTKTTPRLPGSGNGAPGGSVVSPDKLASMDEAERARYLKTLSLEELGKLQKQIK